MGKMSVDIRSKSSDGELLALIAERVAPFYQSLDEWHGPDHGSRVVSFAKRINQSEHGDPFLVEAGAWLHQYHDNLGELGTILEQLPITDPQRSKLFEIVERCRPHKISDSSSLEARIVFDADALELMGPSGIFREVLCNAVARGQNSATAIALARQVQELIEGKLQTQGGRTLAEPAIRASDGFWREYQRWEAMLATAR
jgi:HD superfamily phosphodiesterase